MKLAPPTLSVSPYNNTQVSPPMQIADPPIPPRHSLHWVVHLDGDLVSVELAGVGEPLEVDDEDVRKTPDGDLLGGLPVRLALGTEPYQTHRRDTSIAIKVP